MDGRTLFNPLVPSVQSTVGLTKNLWPVEPTNGPLDWADSVGPLSNISVSHAVKWNGRPSWLFDLNEWQSIRTPAFMSVRPSTWYVWSHYLWPISVSYNPTMYVLDQDDNVINAAGGGSKSAGEWSRVEITFETGVGDTAIKLQHDGLSPPHTFHVAGMMVELGTDQDMFDVMTDWVPHQPFSEINPRRRYRSLIRRQYRFVRSRR